MPNTFNHPIKQNTMTIYEKIGGRQIYVSVAKGLSVRISLRELQVSITNWVRNQTPYSVDVMTESEQAVVLKFKGQQELLAEKSVTANNIQQPKTT